MPAVARGNGTDSVFSKTGTGRNCASPLTTSTDECSGNVRVNGVGVVRIGDKVAVHNKGGCVPDESVLTSGSSKVRANGKAIGRIGDQYTADNTITSGSSNVFIGG